MAIRSYKPTSPGRRFQTVSTFEELGGTLVERLGIADKAVPTGKLRDLVTVPMPMVFLKQFRDAVKADIACFQSIQEATAGMTQFHSGCIYFDQYEILFEDWESHPLRRELGLPQGAIPVEQAFWALFDFEIGFCKEVWRAP